MNDSLLAPFLEGFKRGVRLSIALPIAVVTAVVATVVTLCVADDAPASLLPRDLMADLGRRWLQSSLNDGA